MLLAKRQTKAGLIPAITICLVLLSSLYGCTGNDNKAEVSGLQKRVADLEKENAELQAKLKANGASTTAEAPAQPKPSNETAPTGSLETATPPAGNSHPSFTDISGVAQKTMIADLAKIGLFDGTGNEFKPQEKITRGQYVAWLFNAYNAIMPGDKQIYLAPDTSPFFKDLKDSDPAYKYAQALANAGYSVGYEDGSFKSAKPITREEMIAMKVGVDCGKTFEPWRSQMESVWKFSDGKDVAERYTGYLNQDFYVSGQHGSNIQRAFGKTGTFHPKAPVTRAEAAGTLWQMGQFGHQGHTAQNILSTPKG